MEAVCIAAAQGGFLTNEIMCENGLVILDGKGAVRLLHNNRHRDLTKEPKPRGRDPALED
jgi:hypothetical protein